MIAVLGISCACGKGRGKGASSNPMGQWMINPGEGNGYYFANYFIGSDLEDGRADKPYPVSAGLATADLLEIAEGLSGGRDSVIGVLVAMGGAKKNTWNGVKYLDGPCVIKDSQDGIFGNDGCATDVEATTSMSRKETLVKFLKKVKERSAKYKKTIVNFWDHGAGAGGFGLAQGPGAEFRTLLKSSEIRAAFQEADLRVDLISFDACLMASVEVAFDLRQAGSFLLASEERVPSIGFDYRSMLGELALNPTASMQEVAAKFGEAYLNGKSIQFSVKDFAKIPSYEHKKNDKQKTISTIKLDEIGSVAEAAADLFNTVSEDPKQLQYMLASANTVQRFGEEPSFISGQKIFNSFDLKDLLDKWDLSARPELAAKSQRLKDALGKSVVWKIDDGRTPKANGLSIKDPVNIRDWLKYDKTDSTIASSWANFGSRIRNATLDSTPPILVGEDPGKCQTPEPDYRQGICTEIRDDGLITQVNAYTFIDIDGLSIAVATERAPYLPLKNRFVLPDSAFTWVKDGGGLAVNRYKLCNIGTDDCLELPLELETIKPLRAKAWGQVNDEPVKIDFVEEVVKENGTIYWMPRVDFFRTLSDTEGNGQPKEERIDIYAGDRIKIQYPVLENDKIAYRYSRELVKKDDLIPEVKMVPITGQVTGYRFLLPFDANGNSPSRANWLVKPI